MTLASCRGGREWDLWSQWRKKAKTQHYSVKEILGLYNGGKLRGLCHHLGSVHIQCVASFLTEKLSTWSIHESKQMWSIWFWCFSLDLFFVHSLKCSWNYWTESDRLEFGLASGAFDPFSSYLSKLHRQVPALPPKTPCTQGLYQSAVPLEHFGRTCLQKCISRRESQLPRCPGKADFWTVIQISHEPTHENTTASTPDLPIPKQGGGISLLIFSVHPSLQKSNVFSHYFLNSLQFIQTFYSCRFLGFVFSIATLMFYFSLLFSAQISSRSRSLRRIYYLYLFSGLNNTATFIIMQFPLCLRSLSKIFKEIGSNKIPYKLLNNLIHFDSLRHTFFIFILCHCLYNKVNPNYFLTAKIQNILHEIF